MGVCGGIAAYKIPVLVRLLVKEGAEVKVIMTESAESFVTAQTLSVLSKNKVYKNFFDHDNTWNNHVHLANWADLFLFAPLTANTLSKMATGICDNLLLTTYYSATCKIFLAPAMDLEMYRNPVIQSNLLKLDQLGHEIIPPDFGELASGLIGEGRLAEPDRILVHLKNYYQAQSKLLKKALVNAGPTYEPIDSVRFVGNRSSGKMGIAIAESLTKKGYAVTLVLGPSQECVPDSIYQILRVETAAQMYDAMIDNFDESHLVVCAAAVADYKPEHLVEGKIKKNSETLELKLTRNKDILKTLGLRKKNQFLVGFALESENLVENARKKLIEKNLDLIIANTTNSENPAFNSDNNHVLILDRDNNIRDSGLNAKKNIADFIVDHIHSVLK